MTAPVPSDGRWHCLECKRSFSADYEPARCVCGNLLLRVAGSGDVPLRDTLLGAYEQEGYTIRGGPFKGWTSQSVDRKS